MDQTGSQGAIVAAGCWEANASAVTGHSLAAYLARCSGDGACLHRTAPYGAAQSKWQKIWAFPESWPITTRFATRRARPERTGRRTGRDGRIAAAEHVITRRRGGCATAAHCFRSYSRPIAAAIRFEHALCIIGFGLKAWVWQEAGDFFLYASVGTRCVASALLSYF